MRIGDQARNKINEARRPAGDAGSCCWRLSCRIRATKLSYLSASPIATGLLSLMRSGRAVSGEDASYARGPAAPREACGGRAGLADPAALAVERRTALGRKACDGHVARNLGKFAAVVTAPGGCRCRGYERWSAGCPAHWTQPMRRPMKFAGCLFIGGVLMAAAVPVAADEPPGCF